MIHGAWLAAFLPIVRDGLPALSSPGQQEALFPHIIAPEGRFHSAGEHASLSHA